MLNTDNVHVAGVSIDAAGFSFMPIYDPGYDAGAPSATRSRYSYRNQAPAIYWSLQRLAIALSQGGKQLPVESASSIVERFPYLYRKAWLHAMGKKLGLARGRNKGQKRANGILIERLLSVMELTFSDFTSTFRCLMPCAPKDGKEMLGRLAACGAPLPPPAVRADELKRRASRIRPPEPRELLDRLRDNQRLTARVSQRFAQHDEADRLEKIAVDISARSVDDQHVSDALTWNAWLSDYAEHCSIAGEPDHEAMAKANPIFVPRPWIVDAAVIASANGDFSKAQRVLDLLPHAFDKDANFGDLARVAPAAV
jgi:uncharacterized protein YdiU (UPF0061 family)